LYTNFSLPKQADAVRCAVLKRYGGIWFDTDTIITSDGIRDLICQAADFVLIGYHIGFIVANKQSAILRKWHKYIKRNIRFYRRYKNANEFYKRILGKTAGRFISAKPEPWSAYPSPHCEK
jgi:mannosyltransferase OCH1-like enzyme